jgi:hypothetical protein
MFDSSQRAELAAMFAPVLKRLDALESRPDAEQTAAFFAGMKGEDVPVEAEAPPDATPPAPAKHAKSKKKDAAAAA